MGSTQGIHQSPARAWIALEIAGEGLWEIPALDTETTFDPTCTAHFTPRFCEMLGHAEAGLPERFGAWLQAVLPEDREHFLQAHRARLAQPGTSTTVEYRVQTSLGEIRWWQEIGRVIAGDEPGTQSEVGVVRDVTEAKHRESEQAHRYQLLEYTQELARVGGWELDMSTSKLTWLTETARIHEVSPDYVPNVEEGINFYAPEHVPVIADAVARCQRGEEYDVELDIITAKGNRVNVQATGRPHIEDGKVTRLYGAFRDISETKRREEELRRQLAVITQQQRAILDLSTPILQLWDNVITLPLIGTIDTGRAAQIMDRLLSEVVRVGARFAILDLTGVDTVDTTTADQLFRISRAVDLLGAKVLLCGLTPPVAQTMTALGIDLSVFSTYRNLQEALRFCLQDLAPRSRTSTGSPRSPGSAAPRLPARSFAAPPRERS
ncbi:PAS domain-containing protein [Chondromyces apiculatus]|uniref:RsbR, positive regulator of sigma-B n=1 Tax=Chondromyces apiculatus DSM 436 TaxID=1192034 RepID=A0A017TBN5_9BACT|nr:PAS domain-containing protein [Chondromyces apiculatus]EYF06235.1 RsbR, positive regulator of sigma-B [Chondromyces apiculatus DSM 436]